MIGKDRVPPVWGAMTDARGVEMGFCCDTAIGTLDVVEAAPTVPVILMRLPGVLSVKSLFGERTSAIGYS